MLSRIADSMFWMTRYTERADSMLRMLKIHYITSLDRASDFSWKPVLAGFTDMEEEDADALANRPDDVLRYLITNKGNMNSIVNVISRARENARGMQDHVSKEMWECLNKFYHKVHSDFVERAIDRDEQIIMLGELIDHCMLFVGVCEVTMPRGQGWNYMNLGKFIERGGQTLSILDVRFGSIGYDLNDVSDILYWRNMLLSLSGYELYMKQYRTGLLARNVADMVLLNAQFPRSVLYCVIRLGRVIEGMPEENANPTPQLKRIAGRLRAKVEFADLDAISVSGLHDFFTELKEEFYGLSDGLGKAYFNG